MQNRPHLKHATVIRLTRWRVVDGLDWLEDCKMDCFDWIDWIDSRIRIPVLSHARRSGEVGGFVRFSVFGCYCSAAQCCRTHIIREANYRTNQIVANDSLNILWQHTAVSESTCLELLIWRAFKLIPYMQNRPHLKHATQEEMNQSQKNDRWFLSILNDSETTYPSSDQETTRNDYS